MESGTVIGISILVFTYGLFSWALGRYMNKKKDPKPSELNNFLQGSWVIGLILVFLIAYLYFG